MELNIEKNGTLGIKASLRLAMLMYSDREFFTPEMLLLYMLRNEDLRSVIGERQDVEELLEEYIDGAVPYLPEFAPQIEPSAQMDEVDRLAEKQRVNSSRDEITLGHVVHAMSRLEDSMAAKMVMELADGDMASLLGKAADCELGEWLDSRGRGEQAAGQDWKQWAACLNDIVRDGGHNPLVGRQHELERTMQVLCRKDKNNPLHVGEAGVGKTAIAYGLAEMIEAGRAPAPLAGCRIYSIDLGALLAGTQFRGDFEQRIKSVLQGAESEGNAILYIDEIHMLVGAGRTNGDTIDAANLLKPYLEQGALRFMGATTHDEYSRTIQHSKAFARRFEVIAVEEPSQAECVEILNGIKSRYEEFHHAVYTPEAIEYAVEGSAKHIPSRRLPDKAIDLIDEAGAWLALHPTNDMVIDKKLIAETLAKICRVDTLAAESAESDSAVLMTLEADIKAQIYGQDQAVQEVAQAVQLGSAGLIDDDKPLASLLFVGPTGVGKTELARTLAKQLGVTLLRFDMSEYAEKHTVAKLIGSPAGYVGYEDGGLLTDAIRRSPQCVLLLDELEKAHADIYNILLQVMDYAALTDNRGQKADFRHVVLIMTTNAGAQHARSSSLGFVKGGSAGAYMMKAVKQTFKPEFLNRLTSITVFNDMDRRMAEMVLDKKLGALAGKLRGKGIELEIDGQARGWLLEQGFSPEYGGREIDRVLTSRLKPLLTRAILFGSLKHGGKARVGLADGALSLA